MAITTSRVRLGCASSAGMLASAEKTCNTEPSFGDLRRGAGTSGSVASLTMYRSLAMRCTTSGAVQRPFVELAHGGRAGQTPLALSG